VFREQQEQQAHKERQVLQVRKEFRELLAHKEHRVIQVLRAHKAFKGPQEPKERKEIQEHREHRVTLVRKEHKDLRVVLEQAQVFLIIRPKPLVKVVIQVMDILFGIIPLKHLRQNCL
jgi:hypothetical protein